MTREDDIKKEMARIKASKHYQDHQAAHAEEIVAAKALVAKPEPHRLGTTLDGRSDVWAPVSGPTAAQVEHLKTRKVWMCSWCRATMYFRGRMMYRPATRDEFGNLIEPARFGPKAIVDFDGKVYHSHCYYEMDRQRPKGLPEGKESEDELQRAEGVRQGRERGLPGGVPKLPLHPGDLGCAGEEVRDPGEDGKGGG